MNIHAAQQRIALLGEDGSIPAALRELDRKLSSWLEVMSRAQTALRDRAQPQAVPQPTGRAAQSETPARPATSRGMFVVSDPQALPSGRADARRKTPGKVGRRAPPAAPPEVAALGAEEEALLATLDEETATAIRVKRRLGGTKSVRELIEEATATESAPGSGRKSGKKGWWRRNDE